MTSKKLLQFMTVAGLAMSLTLFASGQMPAGQPAPQQPPDQVDQLAQMIGLTEEQTAEIRAAIDEISPKIEALQTEAQEVQQELEEISGADFDEAKIRETATKLGELTGKITAESVILQSMVDGIFTDEQRQRLEDLERQQQQMQRQMQQQQMQQMMQQQQPPPPPTEAPAELPSEEP